MPCSGCGRKPRRLANCGPTGSRRSRPRCREISRRLTFNRPIPRRSTYLTTIPSTSGDRPPTAIIPPGITRTSAMDLDTDSALAFTSAAFSAAWDGVAGAGDVTGAVAQSFWPGCFSIITASAGADLDLAGYGRTMLAIGWASPIRIAPSIAATAQLRLPAPDPRTRRLRVRGTVRRRGLVLRKRAVGAVSARRDLTASRLPMVGAAHTAPVRRTAATTVVAARCPAIALARHMAAATARTAARPPIAPARHTEEAADPTPALPIAAVAPCIPAAASTVVVAAVASTAVAAATVAAVTANA